jgi:hypothetical protein
MDAPAKGVPGDNCRIWLDITDISAISPKRHHPEPHHRSADPSCFPLMMSGCSSHNPRQPYQLCLTSAQSIQNIIFIRRSQDRGVRGARTDHLPEIALIAEKGR